MQDLGRVRCPQPYLPMKQREHFNSNANKNNIYNNNTIIIMIIIIRNYEIYWWVNIKCLIKNVKMKAIVR